MFRVLTIAGSDSGGGAGIQADIKTICALGGYAASVITSITAQNTIGVQGVYNLPKDIIKEQMDSVLADINIDAVKTGMLANSEIILAISSKIKEYNISKVVVDPVMVATSGDVLLEKEAIISLKNTLIPLSYIITPNIAEAEVLVEREIKNINDMHEAAKKIYNLGPQYVLIKGGHLLGDAIDILYDGQDFFEFKTTRIHTNNTHGTGCSLSAAIATFLADNKDIIQAVSQAKKYLTKAINAGKSWRVGQGNSPVNHFYFLAEEAGGNCDL